MNSVTMRTPPRAGAVLREQLLNVAIANRLELLLLAGLALVGGLVHVYAARTAGFGDEISFVLVDLASIITLFSVLVPYAVWKGSEPSRRGYLWAMPVDRSRHVLLRLFAGWLWLMLLVGCALLVIVIVAWLGGGEVLAHRGFATPVAGSLPPGMPRLVRLPLSDYGWFWLVPFVSATLAYLAASIPVLASDHPFRWYAAIWFGGVATVLLVEALGRASGGSLLEQAVFGRFGMVRWMTGLSAGTMELRGPAGEPVRVFLQQPDIVSWSTTALLWGLPVLVVLLVLAARHQER